VAGEGLNLAHPVTLRISPDRAFRADLPARAAPFLVEQNEVRAGYLSISVTPLGLSPLFGITHLCDK
jgi:hypothetical protein